MLFSVLDDLEQSVLRYGDKVAVVDYESSLTFSNLYNRAHLSAQALIELGVMPGDRVGVCMAKSSDQIIAILAVLYSNAIFVPILPSLKKNSISHIVNDSGMTAIIVDKKRVNEVEAFETQLKIIMGKIYNWFEERLEIQSIADDISSKYVPPHVNIFYCFGGIVFTLFLVQVATGFAMTFYYRPSVADAFASIEFLMTQVNFGWLIRSIHRWSASMMVLMMILHVFRVYLTGGFKKPRELTWVTGVILASVTVSFGVTGYSLPWDQVGYWACKIVTGVPDAIPVVGTTLVELLRGGASVGQGTLTRFYSLHTFVLPLITAVLMLAHFLMIRKQGISGPL